MFKNISARLQYPLWVGKCERYKRLDLLDRLLDGTFYDHLPYGFYDEADQQGKYIALKDRRPSVQFRFCSEVASYTSRKLFAGNHAPRVRHKDDETKKLIRRILRKAKFIPTMLEAAKLGSIGSVAVTFCVDRTNGNLRISMRCWRSKYCEPSFDDMGELTSLRVQFVTTGAWLAALGAPGPIDGEPIDRGLMYWFIRDYGQQEEVTYRPIKERDWNPIEGFVAEPTRQLLVWGDPIKHNLGFVPGHWFKNLVGGCMPDGACTFEPGIANSIELDYTMSQIGRGIRYGAAPTLVVKGNLVSNPDDEDSGRPQRGPTTMLHLQADFKEAEQGGSQTGNDAKLLEMNGSGTEAALKFIDKLHDQALEAVAAARKDPEKMKGPMSGRAMEFIDQEFYDLVMELREQYGEDGATLLARKMLQAVDPNIDLGSFTLGWPRLFQPTPTDIAQIIPALAIAIDPLKAGAAMPAEPGGTDGQGVAKPGKPATTGPDPAFMLIDVATARAWLADNMDLHLLNDDDDDPEEPDENEGGGNAPEDVPEPVDIANPAPDLDGGIPRPTDETINV